VVAPDESFCRLETTAGRLFACLWTYCTDTDPYPRGRVTDGRFKQDGLSDPSPTNVQNFLELSHQEKRHLRGTMLKGTVGYSSKGC